MELRTVSLRWIAEKKALLADHLPKEVQQTLLPPDETFYAGYDVDHARGLRLMAAKFFVWLGIEPNDCVVDFCDPKKAPNAFTVDTAGVFSRVRDGDREREVILLRSDHANDAFDVAAILAHEIMHLYLNRKNIELANTWENELLTDLATVSAGLGLIVLNGKTRRRKILFSALLLLLGRIGLVTEQKHFGYLSAKEYGGYVRDDLAVRGEKVQDVLGYLRSTSRSYLRAKRFARVKPATPYIALADRRYRSSLIIQTVITAIILVPIFFWVYRNGSQRDALRAKISVCKQDIKDRRQHIDQRVAALPRMESDTNILQELQQEIEEHDRRVDACNVMVEEYQRLR